MKKNQTQTSGQQRLLMWLCWLVYVMAYLGRYSYNANVNLLMQDYGVDHTAAGLVATFFFFAYGVGQVGHGLLCKYYPQRYSIPLVLLGSSLINLPLFFGGFSFGVIKFLWLANGLLQSVLWPLMVLTLSRNLDEENLHRAILLMSSTTAVGTLITYGSSAALVRWSGYRFSFLLGAAGMLTAAVLWLTLFRPCGRKAPETAGKAASGEKKRFVLPLSLVLLGVFAAADNFMKDGLQTWVPAILSELYQLPDDLSIILSLVLPVLGLFGAMLAVSLNRKIPNYVTLTGLFFACAAGLIALIRFCSAGAAVLLLLMGCVVLLAHAINNVVTGIAPLELRDRYNSGAMAGVLNGCCYVGSTVTTYALGRLADTSGWNAVFTLLMAVAAAAAVIGLLYSLFRRTSSRL